MERGLALLLCLVLFATATVGLVVAILFRNSEISDAMFALGGVSFVVFGLPAVALAWALFRRG